MKKKMEIKVKEEFDFLYKYLMIGDTGTGKSNLSSAFVDDIFREEYIPSVNLFLIFFFIFF